MVEETSREQKLGVKTEGNGSCWILWIETQHGTGTAENQRRPGSNSRVLEQSSYSPGKATRAQALRSIPGGALGFCN